MSLCKICVHFKKILPHRWFYCLWSILLCIPEVVLANNKLDSSAVTIYKAPFKEIMFSEEDQNLLRSFALTSINFLLENNILKIGGIDLRNISSEVKSVKYFAVVNGYTSAQKRIGHMYLESKKKIRLSSDLILKSSKNNPNFIAQIALLLHETLGALGYTEYDYQISSTIVALHMAAIQNRKVFFGAQNYINPLPISEVIQFANKIQFSSDQDRQSIDENKNHHFQTYTDQIIAEGGVSEGGSGGDLVGMIAKVSLIERLLRDRVKIDLLNFSINFVNIETYGEYQCPQIDIVDFNKFVHYTVTENKISFVIPNSCMSSFDSNFYPGYHIVQGFIDLIKTNFFNKGVE